MSPEETMSRILNLPRFTGWTVYSYHHTPSLLVLVVAGQIFLLYWRFPKGYFYRTYIIMC